MKYCFKCSAAWDGNGQPGFGEICPKCRADLHACLNCKFYDTSKSNQCFANVEEPVIYKDRFNFCEEYRFAEKNSPPSQTKAPSTKSKEAFNNLFKKKP